MLFSNTIQNESDTNRLSVKKFSWKCDAYSCAQVLDDGGLKNVAEGDPVEEAEKSVESGLDQRDLVGFLQDFTAELENLRELMAHRVLQVLGLHLGHLLCGVVENLLAVWYSGEKTRVSMRSSTAKKGAIIDLS